MHVVDNCKEKLWNNARFFQTTNANILLSFSIPSARSKFWGGGVTGSEDFACATLHTTFLDFQDKI